jgi:paraquat-inducible protein A
MIAAAIVFVGANTFPLMELEAQGIHSQSTLFGTVLALNATGWPLLALLVLATTIIVPGLQLGLSLAVLVPVKLGRVPRALGWLSRALDMAWPWGMVEVFLLGAMVSLVKLTKIASVDTGAALYLIGAYSFLISAAVAAFDNRAFWERVQELRA